MSLVYSTTPDGIVVASRGSDYADTARALREYDDELRLVIQGPDEYGPQAFRVYRYMGSERPIQFVCGWWDEYLNPYPELSTTGLLEIVKRLDRNNRGHAPVDPVARNRELAARRRVEGRKRIDEIAHEFDGRLEGKRSSPLPRSRSLQLARQRQRAKNPSLYQ